MEIVKGTQGALLSFTINDKGGPVRLTGATVEVVVKSGKNSYSGNATIVDEITGACSMELGDFFISDPCYAQIFVNFGPGKHFPSDIQTVIIRDSLKG